MVDDFLRLSRNALSWILVGVPILLSSAMAADVPLSETISVGPGGPDVAGYKPSLAIGSDGVQGFVWVRKATNESIPTVQFSRSTDHGATWSAPVDLESGVLPKLATSDGATWMVALEGTNQLRLFRSPDSGLTWDTPSDITIQDIIYNLTAASCGGGRWVAAWDQAGQKRTVYTASSTDDGVTWSAPVRVAEGRMRALVSDGGTAVLLWQLDTAGGLRTLYSRRTVDGGRRWSPTATAVRHGQSLPTTWTLATDGAGRWLVGGVGGSVQSRYLIFSTDDGYTWQEPVIEATTLWYMRAAADGHGNWLLAGTGNGGAQFYRSCDHGKTWLAPQALPVSAIGGTDVAMDAAGHWTFATNRDDARVVRSMPELDTDGDGLPDMAETNTGVYISEWSTGTDPENPDTDGDGSNDGAEVNVGSNPLGAVWPPIPPEPLPFISARPAVSLGDGSAPQVVTDGSGRWGVAWTTASGVKNWATSDDNGESWEDAVSLGACYDIRVAARENGPWIMVYNDVFATPKRLMLRRSSNRGASWTAPQPLGDYSGKPTLLHVGGRKWLVVISQSAMSSHDDGQTWSDPIPLSDTVTFKVTASDHKGRCVTASGSPTGGDPVAAGYSTDYGATWLASTAPPMLGHVPDVLGLAGDGHTWIMACGDNTGYRLPVSYDGGATWNSPPALEGALYGLAAIDTDHSGSWLVAHLDQEGRIVARVSHTRGATWSDPCLVAPFGGYLPFSLAMDRKGHWVLSFSVDGIVYVSSGSIIQYNPLGPLPEGTEVPALHWIGLSVLMVLLACSAARACSSRSVSAR